MRFLADFKHHRKVEQRDSTSVRKLAPVKKSIYSLPDLRELMAAANVRYLAFISALEDPSAGTKALRKVAEPAALKLRQMVIIPALAHAATTLTPA